MKMQHAELEFVTFDAQDVIATSGPTTGVSAMLITIGQGMEFNTHVDDNSKLLSNTSSVLGSLQGHKDKPNNWLYFKSDDTGTALLTADNSSTATEPTVPDGYYFEKMSNYNDILNWLNTYRGKQ